MPSVEEIKTYMRRVCKLIKEEKFEPLDDRYKYTTTLKLLTLKPQDVLDDIMALDHINANWFEVEEDKDARYPGEVWQCVTVLHNVEIYIKLKIKEDSKGEFLLIMSYHLNNLERTNRRQK